MCQDAVSALRARGLRVTPQRRAILGAFAGRADEHLSADEVHARALREVPEIGRGTVYATLAELTELGLLAAFGSPEPVRFETNTAAHSHFRCRLCLRLFDIEVPPPDTSELTRRRFVVDQVAVTAEGTCADCRDYERGLSAGAAEMAEHAQLETDTLGVLAVARHQTDFGPLLLAASANGVVRIVFGEHADFASLEDRARSRRGSRAARARVEHLLATVGAYLAGGREPPHETIDWDRIAAASRGPLEAVLRIPYGQSRSYERVCELDAYDCGYVMGTNPLPFVIPCHRVTRGGLAPDAYVGGAAWRTRLANLEHVAPS